MARGLHSPLSVNSGRGKTTIIWRILLLLVLVVFATFNLMLAIGAASIVDDCVSVACGQAAQSLLAFLAAGALGAASYRLFRREPFAKALLLGTSPLLVVHVVVTILDPNESLFFLITSAPVPLASGITLLTHQLRKT